MAAGFRRPPSVAVCTIWATSGNARVTCCRLTPSWRKKRHLRRLRKNQLPREVVLAADETDLLLFPPLRARWSLRGEPAPVPISGANAKRVLFGALNIDTGHRLLLARKRHRGEDFRAFLEEVNWHYRGWQVALLLDEDSSHTAAASQKLAVVLGIDL